MLVCVCVCVWTCCLSVRRITMMRSDRPSCRSSRTWTEARRMPRCRRWGASQPSAGEGHLFRGLPGNLRPCVCVCLCVWTYMHVLGTHCGSAGDHVFIYSKAATGKAVGFFCSVNGCVRCPVAIPELMVSFRVRAHLRLVPVSATIIRVINSCPLCCFL